MNAEQKNPETILDELKKTNTIEMSTNTDIKSIEVELGEKEDVAEEMKKENTAKMSLKIDAMSREMEFMENDTDAAILAELQVSSEGSSIGDDLNVDKLILIPPEVSRKTLQGNGLTYNQLIIVENTITELQTTDWSTGNKDRADKMNLLTTVGFDKLESYLPEEYWTSTEYKHVLIDKKVPVINQVIKKNGQLDLKERRNE